MESDKKICIEMRKTNNALASFINRHVRQHNHMSDFTMLHGRVLKYVCDHSDRAVYQRDIEEMLEVRRSTATSILKCMEKNGLITRVSVSHDARLKKLCLTERSVSLHRHIESELVNMEKRARNGISEEELECFFRVLTKVRNNFDE